MLAAAVLLGLGSLAEGEEPRYGELTLEQWRAKLVDFDAKAPHVADTVRPLMQITADPTVDAITRRHAALALGRIGGPARGAVPLFIRMLEKRTQDDADAPLWAAKALSLMGPYGREAVPALRRVVSDESRELPQRQMCLEALAVIRGAHPDAVPALVEAVNQPPNVGGQTQENQLRSLAVEALGIAGPDAAVAAPLLVRIVANGRETELTRRRAVVSLGQFGPAADIAVEPLAAAVLDDESPAVRDTAAESLAKMGPRGQAMLMRLMSQEDTKVRARAAQALGSLSAAGEDVVVTLQAALSDRDAQVRLQAAKSLWKITADAQPLLPVATELLTEQQRNVRVGALDLLAEFGPQAETIRPQLEKLQKDDRSYVRRAAEVALKRLDDTP